MFSEEKDHKDSQTYYYYYYYLNLSDFGKSSLCTAASKKEIFFIEVDCSALELMTKLISLAGFKVSLSLFIVTQLLGFNFAVKIVTLQKILRYLGEKHIKRGINV